MKNQANAPKKLKVFCPVCKKKITWEKAPYRPFCSKRCRTIDLGDWASEKYRISGEKSPSEKIETKKNTEKK